MRPRLLVPLVPALVALLATAGVAQAAEPEQLGFLVVSPAKGDLTSAVDVATSDVCTRGQMFAVKLDGPNLRGADRGNLIGTTKISTIGPESYPGHYVVPLPTDLATYLATAAPGQRIKGDYTLTFACRDTLSTADLQIFTATITVDGKGRYAAQGDAATPIGSLIDGYVPGSAGFAVGDPAPPDPAEVAEYGDQQAAVDVSSEQSLPWRAGLVVAGVLLIAGAALAWWRGREDSRESDSSDQDDSVGSVQ